MNAINRPALLLKKTGKYMRSRDASKIFGGLTIRQCQYLEAIDDLTTKLNTPPTHKELQEELVVERGGPLISRLRQKGAIEPAKRQVPRNLTLTEKGRDALSLYRAWLQIMERVA